MKQDPKGLGGALPRCPGLCGRTLPLRNRDLDPGLSPLIQVMELGFALVLDPDVGVEVGCWGMEEKVGAGEGTGVRALSRMLWGAREHIEMLADIVESRSGQPAESARRLVADIDAYRAEQGWSPHGFGGEF